MRLKLLASAALLLCAVTLAAQAAFQEAPATDENWTRPFPPLRDYRVGIVNMNGINQGVELLKSPGYPAIVEEYARTFAKQKQLALDVFLSSHAGQFGLHDKYTPGAPYDPHRFVDPAGYRAAVERVEQAYLAQLNKERQAQSSR